MENTQSVETWPKFDLFQGEPKTYFELGKNQIYTQQHSFKLGILISIFYALASPSSLILISTLIIINILPIASPYFVFMYATQLAAVVLVFILKEALINRTKMEADQCINKRTAKVYRGSTYYENMEWGSIQQGDIIYLCQGQAAPADVILLDSQQIEHRQSVTYVDVKRLNGQTVCHRKKACYLTQILNRNSNQKRFWQQYKKMLTGRITYEKASASMDNFTGYLKLARDPKVQKISIQNLILRQSIVKTSLWVYGLVIYPGMQSKVMKSFKQGYKGKQFQLKTQNKIFILLIILNLILGVIFGCIYLFTGTRLQSNTFIFVYHFLMFSVMLPHLQFVGRDLFLIFQKSLNKLNQIDVRDYSCLEQMGQITYAILSNIGVLTTGQLDVKEIVTQSSIYTFESQTGFDQIGTKNTGLFRRRLGSSSRNSNLPVPQFSKQINNKFLLPIMNYEKKSDALVFKEDKNLIKEQNFQIDDDTAIRLRESPRISKNSKLSANLQPLKLDKNRFYNYVKRNQNEAVQIVKALALCHQAKLYYVASKDKYIGVSNVNSQDVLLKLVNYVGWNLIPKTIDKKQVGITIVEEKEKINEQSGQYKLQSIKTIYNWVGNNSFHISRKLFSVVVSTHGKHTLYCKGKPEDIIERLKISKQTQKIIEQTVASYQKNQSEIVIYAKRMLSQDQKIIYQNEYISLKSSLTTSEQQIQDFSKRYEKNLQFICIIGMSTQISPQAQSLIKHIRACDIKPCIFVNEKSQTTAIKKILTNKGVLYKDIDLQSQSADLIKYYLNQATNLIKNDNNLQYLITLNGKAWKIIRNNSEIMQHFMFVLNYAQAMLAIKFQSKDIGQLTHKIRSSYIQPQKVLGIGYSYSDLKFLGQSNLSISTCQDLPTDIKVDSLRSIIETLKLGPYLLKIKLFRKSLIYYRVITIFTVTFLYQIIMSFYSTSKTINGFLVYFYLVIYTILQIIYGLFILRTPLKVQDPSKYSQFKKAKLKYYSEYIEAFLHGFIITISLFFNLAGSKVDQAKVFPIQAFDLSIFIAIVLTGCLRNIFNNSFTKASYILTCFITICTMGLCLYFANLSNQNFQRVFYQFYYIFKTYDSITAIINCTLFCLAISFFFEEIIKKNLLYRMQVKNAQKQKKQEKMQMIELIKHLFIQEQNMQKSIQEIVSSQLDVNRLKINKYLQIKNQEQNIKYLSEQLPKTRKTFMTLMLILSAFYLIQFLLDLLFITKSFENFHLSLIFGFVISLGSFIMFYIRGELYMCAYKLISILMIVLIGITFIYCFKTSQNYQFLIICMFSIVITQYTSINFFIILFLMCSLIIVGLVCSAIKSQYVANKIFYPTFEILCTLYNLQLFYQVQISSKISFIKTQSLQKQSNYVSDILSILVPNFIKNHLQGSQFALQQQQKKVSILFCYVCNFDQIVKQQGTNVVPLMDQLFRQFDQLCHNFAVQKIQTVGQTYMAATGIKAYQNQIQSEMKKKNQVQRLLKMAIQMLQKSKDIMWGTKKNKKLKIKIGIHHGNVIIGVIGFHKPQFSLIGDTVNTTSRHCSTAGPGEIVISSVAYELLRKFSSSSFIKIMKNMKGLGQVPVYKYNNNLGIEHNLMKARIRFQVAVKRVIQQLKDQGKITYKKFKASELIQKVMVQERRSTKRMTRYSQARKSLETESHQINLSSGGSKQNKYNDLLLKYNNFMELQENNSKFKKHLITKHFQSDRIKIIILAFIYLVSFILSVITQNYKKETLALTSIGIVVFPILFFLYKKSLKHKIFNVIFVILHGYLMLALNLNSMVLPQNYPTNLLPFIGNYYSIMTVIVCSSQKAFRFIHTLVLACFGLIISGIILGINKQFDLSIIYQLFFYILLLFRKHSALKEYYENYNQSIINQNKTQEQSALVSQLLPKHAYEKLKNQNIQNKLELTDRFESSTILFADIKGFTAYSNKNTPAAVVKMLRQLFQQFDKLCLKYNVYKVYTIGDCYVVLGFTNCYQRDYLQQAKNVVNMGLAMVETIQKVRELISFPDLDMRIGIHTGTIIGGIIGTQIVRYDIYGPDVMVANKFQQFGKTGYIHISQSTKQILDQDKKKSFNIAPNGIVKVEKLNAQYNGYILTKKKFQI